MTRRTTITFLLDQAFVKSDGATQTADKESPRELRLGGLLGDIEAAAQQSFDVGCMPPVRIEAARLLKISEGLLGHGFGLRTLRFTQP